MSEEIKPCPFCGEPAEQDPLFIAGGILKCSNGSCALHFIRMVDYAWNSRPIEDALRARVKELEEAVSEASSLLEGWAMKLQEMGPSMTNENLRRGRMNGYRAVSSSLLATLQKKVATQ